MSYFRSKLPFWLSCSKLGVQFVPHFIDHDSLTIAIFGAVFKGTRPSESRNWLRLNSFKKYIELVKKYIEY